MSRIEWEASVDPIQGKLRQCVRTGDLTCGLMNIIALKVQGPMKVPIRVSSEAALKGSRKLQAASN